MEPDDLRKGIVRILKPSDQVQTAGTGFIISPFLVATCAHVVATSGSKPSSVHLILDDGRRLTASVEEQYWRDSKHEDVAILRVHKPFSDHIPLKLGTSTNIAGHTFRTYGFPEGYAQGILVKGTIDDDRESALLQLTSQEVTEGVSGAPVFDQQTHRVVGMITGRAGIDLREVERKIKSKKEIITVATGRLEETAFATPSNVLLQICPELSVEDICPYQGLLSFTENDSHFFYGRDSLIDRLIENLRGNPRFLAIVGSSGSGKSSVVQAGLLPRLHRGDISGFENCRRIQVRPGNAPKKSLLDNLIGIFPDLQSSDAGNFWTAVQQHLQFQPNRSLIFIDQFEETFALCNPEDQKDFTEGLLRLLRSPIPLTLILTIRADFYEPLLKSGFGEWLETGQVNVLEMSDEELGAAIVQPAEKVGLQLEPGLVDLILTDLSRTTKNPLPLLEFTLTQLWEAEHLNNRLTSSSYIKRGRVTGAIAQWADDTYRTFSESEQQLTRQILTRLIHYSPTADTRRHLPIANLVNDNHKYEVIHDLIKKLADRRLVVTDADGKEQETVEIIHEALFQEWQVLKKLVQENREKFIQRDKIEEKAEEWEIQGKARDYLLQGKILLESRNFIREQSSYIPISKLAISFVQESLKQRQRRILEFLSFIVIPVILLLLFIEYFLKEEGVKRDYSRLASTNQIEKRVAISSLTKGCWAKVEFPKVPRYFSERLFGNCRSLNDLNLINIELQGTNLRGVDLKGSDLSKANLSNSDLSEANLSYAILREADLRLVNLYRARLLNTDLRGANLYGSYLHDAYFRSAFLQKANLRETDLTEADFTGADLSSANLEGANLQNSNLNGATLLGANVQQTVGLIEQTKYQALLCDTIMPDEKLNNRNCIKISN